jgi:hypothetical protein
MIKDILNAMCEDGYGSRKIAKSLNISAFKVQSLLMRHNLQTKYKARTHRQNKLSQFVWYYTEAKNRVRGAVGNRPTWNRIGSKSQKTEFNITPEYLKKIWKKQKGVCPYSKQKMELLDCHKRRLMIGKRKHLRVASLDRIDPNKGYIRGNVEFVCIPVNSAKSTYTKEETMEFFDSIRDFG